MFSPMFYKHGRANVPVHEGSGSKKRRATCRGVSNCFQRSVGAFQLQRAATCRRKGVRAAYLFQTYQPLYDWYLAPESRAQPNFAVPTAATEAVQGA